MWHWDGNTQVLFFLLNFSMPNIFVKTFFYRILLNTMSFLSYMSWHFVLFLCGYSKQVQVPLFRLGGSSTSKLVFLRPNWVTFTMFSVSGRVRQWRSFMGVNLGHGRQHIGKLAYIPLVLGLFFH